MQGAHRARHAYRPEHLLRPRGLRLGVPGRLGRCPPGQPPVGPLEGQPLSVWGREAVGGRHRSRYRARPGPGGPADEDPRHRRSAPGQAQHPHHRGRPQGAPSSRPDRPQLGCADTAGPVVGRRLHLRVDPQRVRVRELRDRRVLPAHTGLAGLHLQGHVFGALRLGPGSFHPAPSQQRLHLGRSCAPFRRGIASRFAFQSSTNHSWR